MITLIMPIVILVMIFIFLVTKIVQWRFITLKYERKNSDIHWQDEILNPDKK